MQPFCLIKYVKPGVYYTNSCNLNTYVTWRGNEYEMSEDDAIASKHVGSVIIYKLTVNVFLFGYFTK